MTESTDVCGEPTSSGSPCERDPGWGRDADSGPCVDHANGRPSKLDDKWDDIMESARIGLSKKGIAETAGIDESTLHRWEDKHDEFCKSLRRARAQGQRRLIEEGLIGEVDTRMAQFLLERSHGYTKEQEVELSGGEEIGGLSSDDKEMLNSLFDREPQS